jgi:hypothetical protein
VDVITYWRVLAQPSRPLSLMLHLSTTDGTPIAVGDGLGAPFDQWQPGDVIVQRHTLEIPADAPVGQYELHTGAYWLDTLSRLMAGEDDMVILTSYELLD